MRTAPAATGSLADARRALVAAALALGRAQPVWGLLTVSERRALLAEAERAVARATALAED